MKYRLSITTAISAAHLLREYEGPCSRLHGHNWKIKVEVAAEKLNPVGIAIDFKDLKDITWQTVGKYDHQNFNNIPPFDDLNPTAENIARIFYHEIATALPEGVEMVKISIWETDKYLVEYGDF